MAKRYDPTDYLYASARLRAKETGLYTEALLDRLIACEDAAAIADLLAAEGVTRLERADGAPDIAAMLEVWLRAGLDAVRESVPDPRLTLFFEYPYDCNNVKLLEKCRVRGIPARERLSPLGSIPPDKLLAALEAGDLSLLPPHLAAGLREARERFSKSGNPREIDFVLDRAIFADMTAAAAPFPPAAALLAKRIDALNLLSFCRLAGEDELKRALFADAFLEGGTLPLSLFSKHLESGKASLAEALAGSELLPLLSPESCAAREKAADELLFRTAARAGRAAFGAEVPLAFLWRAELAAKNLRILVAMRELGRSDAAIKEVLRAYDL